MSVLLPYCGAAPSPGLLATRFNLDPVLLITLTALTCSHLGFTSSRVRWPILIGWLVAAAALISPLCALSVALFAARVGQHMILVLVAAPLIALGLPHARSSAVSVWGAALAFFIALWCWHMPVPYAATFTSPVTYWAMHITLFGSAVLLWRQLLHHAADEALSVLAAGAFTFMHMGLLGAILCFADHPMFEWHFTTTQVWGLSPLQDQQLGGVFMWVPGIALFLWAAIRSVLHAWASLEPAKPA